MALFYVCDEHKVAFEKQAQAKAHWNFQHEKGDTWATLDTEGIMQEAVPEGFLLREYKDRVNAPTPDRATPSTAVVVTPPALRIDTANDPEAERLDKMLRSLGVPDNEIQRIVNGFVNIPRIREDGNYLSHWLDTHIRADKALKAYIPMIVGDVLGGNTAPVPLPGTGLDGGGARYFQPRGYYPDNPWSQPPVYYPPSQQDPEATKRIEDLNKRFDMLLSTFQEDRQRQEREKQEHEQKEREQQINDKIDKVQETVLDFIKGQSSSGKNEAEQRHDAQITTLMEEIKGMRADQYKASLDAVLTEVANLRQSVAASKSETVGRSTEDLVHDLGPAALDKFDKLGERIQNELKGLREQVGPGVKERLEEAAREPKTIEQIEEQVSTENRIIELVEAPGSAVEVRVEGSEAPLEALVEAAPEAQPAEAEPYARMPDTTRRRRARRGSETSDQVSTTPATTGTP